MFGDFDRFIMRLESKLNDVRYDFLLKTTPRNTSASLSGMLRDFIGLGSKKVSVTVIDLSSVPFDVRPTVAAQDWSLGLRVQLLEPGIPRSSLSFNVRRGAHLHPACGESQFCRVTGSPWSGLPKKAVSTGFWTSCRQPAPARTVRDGACAVWHVCLPPESRTQMIKVTCEVSYRRAKAIWSACLRALAVVKHWCLGKAVPLPTRVQFDKPKPSPNSDDVDFYREVEEWPG